MNISLKGYKKLVVILSVFCIIFSGCSKAKEEKTNDISSVKLKSNQEIVACKITAIYGNEIEYTVVKEQSMSESKKDKMPSASGAPEMDGGNMPQGGTPDTDGGNNSSGNDSKSDNNSESDGKGQSGNDMPAGGPPDMDGGSMPQGGAPDMNGEGNSQGGASDTGKEDSKSQKASGKGSSQDSSGGSDNSDNKAASSDKSSKKIYTLTEETGSTTIPVGTDVITSLGKTTTFSRLSNGDIIKMILEKDSSGSKVVVGVWIVS